MLRLFLCGDVMTGRGLDQVLPFPADPQLYESHVKDARDYVALAEQAHGPIVRPVSFRYIWGGTIAELDRANADVRIINLETSITTSAQPWPKKPIQFKMNPRNIGCLTAARISACALANNHVLDWNYTGLIETLETLDRAGIAHTGDDCVRRDSNPAFFYRLNNQRDPARLGRNRQQTRCIPRR